MRRRQRTLIFMAPTAVICVALTALCVGFLLGRRAGRPTWKKRTLQVAVVGVAVGLIVLMTNGNVRRKVRRKVRRSPLARRALSSGVKRLEPVRLLRLASRML
jgi:hypothetical protein